MHFIILIFEIFVLWFYCLLLLLVLILVTLFMWLIIFDCVLVLVLERSFRNDWCLRWWNFYLGNFCYLFLGHCKLRDLLSPSSTLVVPGTIQVIQTGAANLHKAWLTFGFPFAWGYRPLDPIVLYLGRKWDSTIGGLQALTSSCFLFTKQYLSFACFLRLIIAVQVKLGSCAKFAFLRFCLLEFYRLSPHYLISS